MGRGRARRGGRRQDKFIRIVIFMHIMHMQKNLNQTKLLLHMNTSILYIIIINDGLTSVGIGLGEGAGKSHDISFKLIAPPSLVPEDLTTASSSVFRAVDS